MSELEERALPYLLKLRHTKKIKTLVRDLLRKSEGWKDCCDGWEAAEAKIKLHGWTRQRRLVVVREAPAIAPVGEQARRRRYPFEPGLRDWRRSMRYDHWLHKAPRASDGIFLIQPLRPAVPCEAKPRSA